MKSKLFFLLLSTTIFISCNQERKQEKLPILGHTIFEENDTIYHTIADFQFIDQDSNTVTNETFSDKVYVADFFFTSCPTICPKMKSQLIRVYQKFEHNDEVGILSHTIDPTYDTVALLKDYAARLGVESHKWKFVTGNQDSIYNLAEKSYMSIADENAAAPGGYIHSGAFLLVDKERRIRGFYDGTVPKEVDALMYNIETLLKEYK